MFDIGKQTCKAGLFFCPELFTMPSRMKELTYKVNICNRLHTVKIVI